MKLTNPRVYEMNNMYFCLCDACGSKAWYEDDNVVNSLEDDGTQLIPRTASELASHFDIRRYPICFECEKKISIMLFKTISRKERIQIAKMTPAKRKEWMINLKIVKELEKEEWRGDE